MIQFETFERLYDVQTFLNENKIKANQIVQILQGKFYSGDEYAVIYEVDT